MARFDTHHSALLTQRRFAPLFVCQFLSAFGDNFLRNALGLLVVWSSGGAPGWIVAAASGAFVLPTVVLSGVGGQWADRMDKAALIRRLKLAEIVVALVALAGLALGSLPVLFAGLVASGVISALFGPVKYGILPDQLPPERLTGANALVEGATFAAILAGTILSGLLVGAGAPPIAVGAVVVGTAGLSWVTALLIPATTPAAPELHVQANILASTLDLLRGLRADRRIWRAALANAWFWMVGSVVIALLPGFVRDALGGGARMDTICLCVFAVGIACGSGLASFLSGARIVLLPAALGCAVFGLALIDLWRIAHGVGPVPFGHAALDLFAAAFGGGLLAVPTQAAIQAFSPLDRRARTVAGSNVVGALAMAGMAAVLVLAQLAGLHEPILLGIIGLLCLLVAPVLFVTLSANPWSETAWVLWRILFRIELRGAEHLPRADQPAVITPNHVSWLDATTLFAVMDTPPLFAIDAQVAQRWWVRPFLRVVPTLPVEAGSAYAVRTMVQAVRDGRRLVLFPEGRITITGSLMEVQHGAATIADKAGVPIVPVRLEGLERTFLSRLSAQQTRRALFPRVTVTILPPRLLSAPENSLGKARREALTASLRDTMEEAVTLTIPTDRTLFEAVADAARRHGRGRLAVEDPLAGPLTYRRLLAGADVLGREISAGTAPGEAVGVLLPTANATALCLLGLSSWGRVPAMLNATAGLANLRAAVTAAQIAQVVTSRAFVDKARLAPVLAGLEGQVRFLYIEDIRTRVTRRQRLLAVLRASLPTTRPRVRGAPDDRAVIMFTSGSSGTPKGVVLTHRNLLSNVAQIAGRIGFGRADRVLNTLPMFHAFGLTGGFLLPLTSGVPAYLYPSPLHYAAIPLVAYGWNATAMFGTNTFLRGYARRAQATAFRSVRLVVAGAERVQPAVPRDLDGALRPAHSRGLRRHRVRAGAGGQHAGLQSLRHGRPPAPRHDDAARAGGRIAGCGPAVGRRPERDGRLLAGRPARRAATAAGRMVRHRRHRIGGRRRPPRHRRPRLAHRQARRRDGLARSRRGPGGRAVAGGAVGCRRGAGRTQGRTHRPAHRAARRDPAGAADPRPQRRRRRPDAPGRTPRHRPSTAARLRQTGLRRRRTTGDGGRGGGCRI